MKLADIEPSIKNGKKVLTMDVRERLVELLNEIIDGGFKWHNYLYESGEQLNNDDIASYLIANGITVQEQISVKDRLPEPPKGE